MLLWWHCACGRWGDNLHYLRIYLSTASKGGPTRQNMSQTMVWFVQLSKEAFRCIVLYKLQPGILRNILAKKLLSWPWGGKAAGWVSDPWGLKLGCSALARRCLDLQRQISTLREQICHLQRVIQVQHRGLRSVIQEVRLVRASHRAELQWSGKEMGDTGMGAPALSVCAGDEQLARHAVPRFAHPVFRHPHVFQR